MDGGGALHHGCCSQVVWRLRPRPHANAVITPKQAATIRDMLDEAEESLGTQKRGKVLAVSQMSNKDAKVLALAFLKTFQDGGNKPYAPG